MGWLGKVIGGGIGFVFEVRVVLQLARQLVIMALMVVISHQQKKHSIYVTILASMAKMAKADGIMSQDEVQYIDNFIRSWVCRAMKGCLP